MPLEGKYTFTAGIEAGFLSMKRHGVLGFTHGTGSKPDRYITHMTSSVYPILAMNGAFHTRLLKFGAFSVFFPSWYEEKDDKVGYTKGMKRSVYSIHVTKAGARDDEPSGGIVFRGVEVVSVDTLDATAYTSTHARYTAVGMKFTSVKGFTDKVPESLLN